MAAADSKWHHIYSTLRAISLGTSTFALDLGPSSAVEGEPDVAE